MGGKSRKTGGISKTLIERLKSGNYGKSNKTKPVNIPKKDGKDTPSTKALFD